MKKSEEKNKADYSMLPKLGYLYDDDMYDYPLGACLAIAVRLLTDKEDERIYFDFGDKA